jgi:Peptidase family M23
MVIGGQLMSKYIWNSILRTWCFLGILSLLLLLQDVEDLKAQTSAFLISPYYGTTSVNQDYSGTHPAHDYNLNYTQVLAAASGTVTRVQWYDNRPECHGPVDDDSCGYGLHAYITHSNGYITRYAHLSTVAFALNTTNRAIGAGQIIGTSGNTGWSTGAHLHFEVKDQNGGNADPDAANLWKDGQWATPSRPIPTPNASQAIQVNATTNNSGGFSKGNGGIFLNPCVNDCAGWTRDTANNSYFTLVNGATVDSWARWQPSNIPSGGAIYEVFVFVPSDHATSWQAPFTVRYNSLSSTATTVVDQEGLSNQWVSIGTYRMHGGDFVYLTDASGEGQGNHCGTNQYCELVAHSVQFVRRGTTYIPDAKVSGGWSNRIAVRSNGGTANVLVKCYSAAGSNLSNATAAVNVHQTITVICGGALTAAAVVDANQDVSVAVLNLKTSTPNSSNALIGVAAPRSSSVFYLPLAARQLANATGTLNSEILVQNTSGSALTFQVRFFGAGTFGDYTKSNLTIAARGMYRYDLTNETNLATGWNGSAIVEVTAGNGNAVVASNYNNLVTGGGATSVQTINGLSLESRNPTWFVPFFAYQLANGLNTPVAIQNTSGAQINANAVTLSCVKDPNSPGAANVSVTNATAIPNNEAYFFNPVTGLTGFVAGWYGACRVTANVNLVTFVQMRYITGNTANAAAYEGITGAGSSKVVAFPLIQKLLADGSATAVTIQNLNTNAAANVTFKYYAAAGSGFNDITVGPCAIPAGGGHIHNHRLTNPGTAPCPLDNSAMPNGWNGTLVVISNDQPIEGFIQLTNTTNPSGDTFMAHNGVTPP